MEVDIMYDWICPVCGSKSKGEFPDYNSCDICYWQDDPIQRKDPDYWGGANDLSLNDYKAKWEKEKQAQTA